MFKKSRLREPFAKQHGKRVQTTVGIWAIAPLPYFLITIKVIESEKLCFSAIQKFKTVC